MGRLYIESMMAPATKTRPVDASVVEAIADWCDALHGELGLEEAFSALAAGLGAEAGMLVRTNFNDFRPMRVAVWDRTGARSVSPLTVSFADGRFGCHIARPRTGCVWLASLSDDADDSDLALEAWQARRGLSEFAVLILSGGPGARDHIELHFRNALSPETQAALGAVLPTMARTWANRQVGLISRVVINHRTAPELAPARRVPAVILSSANPSGLSRAEFRVCLLLSRGLSVTGVANELAVSETTVRSHLRSIYAKTETSGLAELVFALLRSKPDNSALSDLRCA